VNQHELAQIIAGMSEAERTELLKAAGVKTGGMSQESKEKLAASMRAHYNGAGMDEATKDKIRQAMLARERKAKGDAAEVERLRRELAALTEKARNSSTILDPSWQAHLDKTDANDADAANAAAGTLNTHKDGSKLQQQLKRGLAEK
jgi:polyhydroxyalkanoate synthesis regulator phasin